MKLVFYIHALAGGGAERVWSVLASSFASRGHEVIIAVDYEAAQNQTYVADGVRVVVLGGSHGQTILRLARLLAREKPDVAVGALAASNVKLTLAAMLSGRLRRTVLTYHGYAESEPQRLSQWGFRLAAGLTCLTARSVCVSDGLLRYLRDRWGASEKRTQRIYNPVLVEGLAGSADLQSLRDRPPLVLAVGRFASYKNFGGLLRAFAAVEHPAARLILLGDGPERGMLAAEVARLGLQDRVEMPGYVAQPWKYFETAKCLVVPSRSESFGLVLVEAMAHGLEVVATDCDGPREILADGRYGALVPHEVPAAMTAAVARALREPSDPAPRMERARSFSREAATDAYENLFRSMTRPSFRLAQAPALPPLAKASPPAPFATLQ